MKKTVSMVLTGVLLGGLLAVPESGFGFTEIYSWHDSQRRAKQQPDPIRLAKRWANEAGDAQLYQQLKGLPKDAPNGAGDGILIPFSTLKKATRMMLSPERTEDQVQEKFILSVLSVATKSGRFDILQKVGQAKGQIDLNDAFTLKDIKAYAASIYRRIQDRG